MPGVGWAVAVAGLWLADGQQAGTSPEQGPSMSVKQCTKAGGCTATQFTAVLDANWRWLHNTGGYTNCYKGNQWDPSFCPDPVTCMKNCALESVSSDQYRGTYGVTVVEGGLRLKFVNQGQYSTDYGSRLYLLDNAAEEVVEAAPLGGYCGYGCHTGCGSCSSTITDGFCAVESNCLGNCNGKWCDGPAPSPSPSPSPAPSPSPSPSPTPTPGPSPAPAAGDKYKVWKLMNREFSFDVDVSQMPCGLNGALYFVEMEPTGNLGGGNSAGAKFGTGYCDAQCPHDIKFIHGEANILNWTTTGADTGIGHYGSCCAEMDIWEANKMAEAYTPHPCKITGQQRCEGLDCGDNADMRNHKALQGPAGHRYDGVCDKDGCDFNGFRMGVKDFFGEGSSFAVDTSKPFTVVTQFITSDGTDSGDLVEIRRSFRQGGKLIPNPKASILGKDGQNSVSDAFCGAQKTAFGDPNDFGKKGGLKAIGEALRRGMVITMSIWDDSAADMLWLDSSYPLDRDPSTPGVARGTCSKDVSSPEYVRAHFPDASVHFFNIAAGEIGTTGPAFEEVIV